MLHQQTKQPECQRIPLPSALVLAVLPGLARAVCLGLCVQHICWGSSWDLPGTPRLWEENSGGIAEKEDCLLQMCLSALVPWDSFTENVCRPCLCNAMQKSLNLFVFCCTLENVCLCPIQFSFTAALARRFGNSVVLFPLKYSIIPWRILYASLKSILIPLILIFFIS